MKKLLLSTTFLLATTPAFADIQILKCSFSNMSEVFFTIYDDGTPARIGVGPGVGNTGWVFYDKLTKAVVIVEKNTDNIPTTVTTVSPSGEAVHSRQLIGLDGRIVAPSQGSGSCENKPVTSGIR